MPTYYSCDSHVVEPPEVFAGLERRFGTRAPQILQNPQGKRGTYIAFGKTMFSVGRLGIAGHLRGLGDLLQSLVSVLAPGGRIVCDSADLRAVLQTAAVAHIELSARGLGRVPVRGAGAEAEPGQRRVSFRVHPNDDRTSGDSRQ